MKRVLITGGAGFIGSHVVDSLLGVDCEVLVIDNLSSGSLSNLNPKARLEQVDIESQGTVNVIKSFKPETIFHFAAQIDVRVSAARPAFDAQQNILNTLNLIETGLENGLNYFAFASSGGAIYGEPVAGPQDETHPERPLSPYGVAKLSVDKYLASFKHHHGLESCSMRFSNVYGPRQNAKGEAGVVSIFINQALSGMPIRINGDGTQTRDFVYVKDLAMAAALIVRHRPQGVFNLGTGIETSIAQLAELLCTMFSVKPQIQNAPSIPGEQRRSVLDYSKAARILNWAPSTSLSVGLQETVTSFSPSIYTHH